MEFLYLKYFKKIAEYEHITRAAQELHVAQSALSRVLKSLETELGVKLFDRSGKNIILNKNGKIMLEYTNQILSLINDMKRDLHEQHDKNPTIIILVKVASKFLPDIISGFHKIHPDVNFIIIQNDIDDIKKNQIWDVCIDASINPIEDKHTNLLLKEEICLAMPKDHPLAVNDSVYLEEVSSESFIGMQKGSRMNEIADYYCNRAGFHPNIILESDNPATLRGLMRIGMGIAFNPIITWKEMSDDKICLVKIKGEHCFRYINLSLKDKKHYSNIILDFKKYLISFFASLKS